MIDPKVVDRIEDEVTEDLDRYDGDYKSWSEVVFDCPSNTLVDIIRSLPDHQQEEGWIVVEQMVRRLGRKR